MNSLTKPEGASVPNGVIWWGFFIYTAAIAFMVQLFLLPCVFTGWHAGNGLLIGLDSLSFHQMAVELSQAIKTQGWSVWQLRPNGQAPAGIAAIIYTFTIPKPSAIIPLNAALHATAAFILFKIIQIFIPDWRKAIWPIVPFLIYPSAMTWYTQLHKDGFFIAGMLFYLFGLLKLSQSETWKDNWRKPLTGVLLMLVGSALVWIVRPYGVQMMQVVGAGIVLFISAKFIHQATEKEISWKKTISILLILFLAIGSITPLTSGGITADAPRPTQREVTKVDISEGVGDSGTPAQVNKQESGTGKTGPIINQINLTNIDKKGQWQASKLIPKELENKLFALSCVRDGFFQSCPNAASNIDSNVVFNRSLDIFLYIPRATEIVFLAPFPTQWFGTGSLEANTMMRRVSAFEMIGIYISYIFLIYALWYWRKRIEIWIIVIFSTGMMLSYSLVIPNIGTLYRNRYVFLMTVMALGIAGIVKLLEKNFSTHNICSSFTVSPTEKKH